MHRLIDEFNISKDVKHLINRTIRSIDLINAEYGRTFRHYLGITCTDGERVLLAADGNTWNASPRIEDMRSNRFFTPEEIALVLVYEEKEKRKREDSALQSKKLEYERLKKELGEKV